MHDGFARTFSARSPPPEFHRPPRGLDYRYRKSAKVAASLVAPLIVLLTGNQLMLRQPHEMAIIKGYIVNRRPIDVEILSVQQ